LKLRGIEMKAKLLSALTVVPLIAAGAFIGAGSANAAKLTSPGGTISFDGSVLLRGILDGDGNLIGTEFDFVPSDDVVVPGGFGKIDIAFGSSNVPGNGFQSFDPEVVGDDVEGQIKDISIFADGTTNPPLFVDDFIVLDGNADGSGDADTTFRLEKVDLIPTFQEAGDDLVVTIGTEGTWFSPDGEFKGSIIFTSQIVDETKEGLFDKLETGIEVRPAKGFSADANAVEVVPEPTTTLGAFLALGLGGLSFRKKKQQIG
jgi:hypothetical protein